VQVGDATFEITDDGDAAQIPARQPFARSRTIRRTRFDAIRMARRSGKRLCLRPRQRAFHLGSPEARAGLPQKTVSRSVMTAHLLRLDHLVISARTLDEGTQYVADTLGVAPAGGGAHPLMRTHNRLLNLWGGVYLEVIAIDPEAAARESTPNGAEKSAEKSNTPRPRLFALDDPATHVRLEKGPHLSHWVARVERPKQLATWQTQYPQRIAPIVPMTRGDFTWGLSVPDDGAFPAWQGAGDGVLPSLIQWDSLRHPSTALPDTGIALKALKAVHPQADTIRAQLDWLGASHLLELQSTDGAAALVAEFETPEGLRTLK
jgi:hypothetical protein